MHITGARCFPQLDMSSPDAFIQLIPNGISIDTSFVPITIIVLETKKREPLRKRRLSSVNPFVFGYFTRNNFRLDTLRQSTPPRGGGGTPGPARPRSMLDSEEI